MKRAIDNRLFWAGVLNVCSRGSSIAGGSYAISALISHHTNAIFPYFYAASGALCIALLAFRLFASNQISSTFSYWTDSISVVGIATAMGMIFLHVDGSVLVTSVILTAVNYVNSNSNTNIIAQAFDARELRWISRTLITVSSISSVAFSLVLLLCVRFLGPNFLVLVSLFMSLIFAIARRHIKPLQTVQIANEEHQQSLLQNPMFRLSILFAVMVTTPALLIDYLFRVQIREVFAHSNLTLFSLAIVGVISSATVLIQLFERQKLALRFGTTVVLLGSPIIVTIFAVLVIFFPSPAIAIAAFMAHSIYFDGIAFVGFQTIGNAIPTQLRSRSRTQRYMLVMLAKNVVTVPLILIFLGNLNASFPVITFVACAFSLLSIPVLLRINRSFAATVRAQVEQRRPLLIASFEPVESFEGEDIEKVVPRIGHRYSVGDALLLLRTIDTDPIPYLIQDLANTRDVVNFEARVRVLARLPSLRAEDFLAQLITSDLGVLPNAVPYSIALRGLHDIGDKLRKEIRKQLDRECELIMLLESASSIEPYEWRRNEIKARQRMARVRFLYYFAALNETRAVLNTLPSIMSGLVMPDSARRGDAINYLEVITTAHEMRTLLHQALDPLKLPSSREAYDVVMSRDPWLLKIHSIEKFSPGVHVNLTEKALFLRNVSFFSSLPGEILEFIAESVGEQHVRANETIFLKGSPADKVCMVFSGEVAIVNNGDVLNVFQPNGLFGELGMIGEGQRTATAIAKTDTHLLTIEKQEFLQLIEDVPEVAKEVIRLLEGYVRKYINSQEAT